MSPPPSKAGTEAVISDLKGLATTAGSLWTQLTDPIDPSSGSAVEVFQERVSGLAGSLPGALKGMSVLGETELVRYVTTPDPPGWICIHSVEMSVVMSSGDDSFRLGFQIPCSDCLS